jgi:hypothetical protein
MIDRRDFAARAPHVIPDWFEPTMPPAPTFMEPKPEFDIDKHFPTLAGLDTWPRANGYEQIDLSLKNIREADELDMTSELDRLEQRLRILCGNVLDSNGRLTDAQSSALWAYREALKFWSGRRSEHQQALLAYSKLRAQERIAQWPWFYADLVIAGETRATR